jgi:hypothetical protein
MVISTAMGFTLPHERLEKEIPGSLSPSPCIEDVMLCSFRTVFLLI